MARIALILPSLAGGGAERVAINLARGFLDRGHAVDLVVFEKTGLLLNHIPHGARIVDLGAARLRSAVKPLADYFRRESPDTVQAFMWPITILSVIARSLSGRRFRLVLSDHTTLSEAYADRGPAYRAFLKASIRLLYPRADARVVVSEGAARDLSALMGGGDIEVIHNPVIPPSPMPGPDPSLVAAWGERRRLLAVGNLAPAKDYPTLLRAVAKVPDAALVIVGEGPTRPQVEALRRDLGLEDRVTLVGASPNVWPFYASAELFVMTSTFEGWAIVIVEALLSGLPVVSTDCPHGPSDILGGGAFGSLVPPGDPNAMAAAIKAALAAPTDPARQAARGGAMAGGDSVNRYAEVMGIAARP